MNISGTCFQNSFRCKLAVLFVTGIIGLLLSIKSLSHYSDLSLRRKDPGNVTLKNFSGTFIEDPSYRPKILIWAKQHRPSQWKFPDLPGDTGGCDVTYDRSQQPTSDAVVFFMKTANSRDLPPANQRHPNRPYVWWCHESPWTVFNYYKYDLKDFHNYFNWTMTYKQNSDVLALLAPVTWLDYLLFRLNRTDGMMDKQIGERQQMNDIRFNSEFERLMSHKTKLAAWIVSDCNDVKGASTRMTLIRKLENEAKLPIEEFGKCARKEIPMNFTILFQTLQSFKFYMAFENALHCSDYFTEKFYYNGLLAGVVPVVYGPRKEDVDKVAPPGSFIHYEDFDDVNALAKYLKELDADDKAYKKYFDWWKSPGVHLIPRFGFNFGSNPAKPDRKLWTTIVEDDMIEYERTGFYHLCRKLRNGDHFKYPKVISDLNKVYFEPEPRECMG